jgi:hypothetical protein
MILARLPACPFYGGKANCMIKRHQWNRYRPEPQTWGRWIRVEWERNVKNSIKKVEASGSLSGVNEATGFASATEPKLLRVWLVDSR